MGFPWSNRYPCFQYPAHNRFNVLQWFLIRFRTAMVLILHIGHHCFISFENTGYWIVSTTSPSQLLDNGLVHLMDSDSKGSDHLLLSWDSLFFDLFCSFKELGYRCFTAPMTNFICYAKDCCQYLLVWIKCIIFNIYQRMMITQLIFESYISGVEVVSSWRVRWWWSGVQWRTGLIGKFQKDMFLSISVVILFA